MQLEALQRQVITDARVLYDAVKDVFPVKQPDCYRGRAFNLTSFLDHLNAVTESYGVLNVVGSGEKGIPKKSVLITAQWLPDECLPLQHSSADVRLEWHVTKGGRRQQWSRKTWAVRRFYFWSYLLHELVHRHQGVYRSIKGEETNARVYRSQAEGVDLKAEQVYLGDYDEIEAYAHDVALEMWAIYGDLGYRDALRQMKTETLVWPYVAKSTYSVYMRAFKTTPKHAALPVFHRKIKRWWDLITAHPEFYQSLHLEIRWR